MKHRLIAPRELVGTVGLSGGLTIAIPPSGIVEIEDRPVMPGFAVWGADDNPPVPVNPTHLRELLQLGFQHAPGAGGIEERPPGRFDGDFWFDTYQGRPLWWSRDAWRTADGKLA